MARSGKRKLKIHHFLFISSKMSSSDSESSDSSIDSIFENLLAVDFEEESDVVPGRGKQHRELI